MAEFYQQRLSKHLKKMMKYLRYVFNDHFLLVSLFLIGGLGFYYSQLLKTLPLGFVWGRPIILVLWTCMLFVGKLATITEEADKVFLLPKESYMNTYLHRAIRHSFWLPLVFIVFVSGMSMPLLVVTTGWSFSSFYFFLLSLSLLKVSHLWIQKYSLYQVTQRQRSFLQGLWLIVVVITLASGLYSVPLVSSILSLVQASLCYFVLNKKEKEYSLDWQRMIQQEKNRLYRIYRFIHLFTDVPEITSSVKRRKYLDFLIKGLKPVQKNTYLYLYSRSFMRVSEYSGLWIRLVVIGMAILVSVNEFWFSLGAALLFIYLIGFQLIPMYTQFDYMVMTKLYPVSKEQKQANIRQLLSVILLITAGVFSVAALIVLPSFVEGLLVLVSTLVEVGGFIFIYLPYRIKKSFS